jgi:hypothetical protein
MRPIDGDYSRFLALRRRVMQAIRRELEEDPCYKSYEGTFELLASYPDYFDGEYTDEPDFFKIVLHCYVLGPARHYEWTGKTFKEALDSAEGEIDSWINRSLSN